MAKPTKKSETKVTRITATDDSAPKKRSAKVSTNSKTNTIKKSDSSPVEIEKKTRKNRRRNPFAAFWGYLKGSWYELRQVRWPDRRATWGMTGALLAFTGFFVVVILLLDAGFEKLFNIILGK